MQKYILGFIAVAFFFVLFFVGTIVNALNADATLRSRIEAFQKQQEASFDTMRKVILEKRGLPLAAKKDLVELLPQLVAGRTGGNLLKSVQEQYPEFNLPLYKDLSRTIEAERHKFFNVQSELFDAKREHDTLLRKPVGGTILAISGRKPVEITVVSSTLARSIMSSGLEDDIQ